MDLALRRSNRRPSILRVSTVTRELRAKGYRIDLPAAGGVEVSDSEIKRIALDLDRLTDRAVNVALESLELTGIVERHVGQLA